jgi:hypothetical protein
VDKKCNSDSLSVKTTNATIATTRSDNNIMMTTPSSRKNSLVLLGKQGATAPTCPPRVELISGSKSSRKSILLLGRQRSNVADLMKEGVVS